MTPIKEFQQLGFTRRTGGPEEQIRWWRKGGDSAFFEKKDCNKFRIVFIPRLDKGFFIKELTADSQEELLALFVAEMLEGNIR